MISCLIPDLPDAAELRPWLARIDASRWYTNRGPLIEEFERRVARFVGEERTTCVSLSSGTSALELGLRAMGVGPGRQVLLPALTFPATALAVSRCGAEPVLADVCPDTWTMTAAIAREALQRERIDVVMPVACYGCPLPASEWDRFADETGVPVFVDAAAALGVQKVGRRAHWAFSLHATKPMGVGEGGLFVSSDDELAARVRRLSNFGFGDGLVHLSQGTNAKLSEYAAAVGLAQLDRWPSVSALRQRVFSDYRERMQALVQVGMQPLPAPPAVLCVRLPVEAGKVASGLAQSAIETRRWYLPPLDEHPAFKGLKRIGPHGGLRLPVTDALGGTLLGLPFHTRLTTADVSTVVQTLASLLDALTAKRSQDHRPDERR